MATIGLYPSFFTKTIQSKRNHQNRRKRKKTPRGMRILAIYSLTRSLQSIRKQVPRSPTDKQTTYGHWDLETESIQWTDSVKIVQISKHHTNIFLVILHIALSPWHYGPYLDFNLSNLSPDIIARKPDLIHCCCRVQCKANITKNILYLLCCFRQFQAIFGVQQ